MKDWHLNPLVPILNFITVLTAVVSVVMAFNSLVVDVKHNTDDIVRVEQKMDINNHNIEKILGRMERKQDKLFNKLYDGVK